MSSDFAFSRYCRDVEITRALERHRKCEALVIPVILRPIEYAGLPFARLQALPLGGKAITSWDNRDDASVDVVRGIRKSIEEFMLLACVNEASGQKVKWNRSSYCEPNLPKWRNSL